MAPRSTNDGYPDSRDPEPAWHALKRIAHEAHQIRQRGQERLREMALGALSGWTPPSAAPRTKDVVSRDEDIVRLATLVAELADILKETVEER